MLALLPGGQREGMGMSLVNFLADWGWWLLSYAVPFLFVLTLVVFFHELGHFLVARACGVRVETFSLGFGKEVLGFNDRHGTRWRLSMIPLGGYVKFFGDANEASVTDKDAVAAMSEEEKKVSFFHKSLKARAAVVAAGPIANFILAVVIFTLLFMVWGRQITAPRIESVLPGSAAEAAGFLPGDLVVDIDGEAIDSFTTMQRIVGGSAGKQLSMRVERTGGQVLLKATPALKEIRDSFGNVHKVGIIGVQRSNMPGDVRSITYPFGESVRMAVGEIWFVVEQTLGYFGRLFVGRESIEQISGPLGIAKMSGQAASISFPALVNLMAILSVSIGLLNLFPIPILDGGHLMFYAIEGALGHPLSEKAQEYSLRMGLAIVLMLFLVGTWNDIMRLVGS